MIAYGRAPNGSFSAFCRKADRPLAIAWWFALSLRGLLPALFAIAMGVLVGAVQRGNSLAAPLTAVGVVFVLLQVLSPLHQAIGANLGSRVAAWLYDRADHAPASRPPGMGHLEDPRLTTDLDHGARLRPRHQWTTAVDFDGLHRVRAGRAGRRSWRRRWCWPPTPGGRRCCWPARGSRRIGCCAKARVARSQHRRSSRGAAARRLRVSPGGRSAGRQGTAAVRTGGMDGRAIHLAAPALARSAMAGDALARAAGVVEPVDRAGGQRHRVLGDRCRCRRRDAWRWDAS